MQSIEVVGAGADAILAARAPHAFMGTTKMGMAAIFETRRNGDCHVILRSGKQYLRQIAVAHDVAAQIAAGERRIVGLMIESHLEEGRRDLRPGAALRPGVSISDACIGWAQTAALLHEPAAAVRARRGRAGHCAAACRRTRQR